jgi:hypothetical protein
MRLDNRLTNRLEHVSLRLVLVLLAVDIPDAGL